MSFDLEARGLRPLWAGPSPSRPWEGGGQPAGVLWKGTPPADVLNYIPSRPLGVEINDGGRELVSGHLARDTALDVRFG